MPLSLLRNFSQKLVRVWKEYVSPKLFPLFSAIEIGGLALAALALWGFAEIADEVLEKETQAFDTTILEAIARLHTPLLDNMMIGVTFLGDPTALTTISVACAALLLLQRRYREALILAIAAGGAVGLNFWLKALFGRARPELWERIVDVSYNSFPSGHATISLVVYGAIGYGLARHFPAWQKQIFSLTVFLVAAIGFSRLYLGVHWPTDVIAGYATGLVWLIACILTLEVSSKYLRRKGDENNQLHRSLRPKNEFDSD